MKIKIPNSTIFKWYEGKDQSQRTPATGPNLNAASNQLLINDTFIVSIIDSILGNADKYNVETNYDRMAPVSGPDGVVYLSLVSGNRGNSLSDTKFWEPIVAGINDENISKYQSWSSAKAQDMSIKYAVALG